MKYIWILMGCLMLLGSAAGCEDTPSDDAESTQTVVADLRPLVGCQDTEAINYLEEATEGDDSCIYAGCTDVEATNFVERATLDDGLCVYSGCTDAEAINYEARASEDDGSCVYSGCSDQDATNYDERASADDGSCVFSGCVDPEAENYDERASEDDGSCVFSGCSDERAINYETRVTVDDGSCVYSGCTHRAALNYDETASVSDDSCEFPAWTSRILYAQNVRWASNRDVDAESLMQLVTTREVSGLMITDLDVSSSPTAGVRFSAIWRENLDGRRWRAHWDLTSEEYNQLWTAYEQDGYRPLDIEGYSVRGQERFAGVWIEDIEGIDWASYRQMTLEGYQAKLTEEANAGRTPIDVEVYSTRGGERYAAIFWETANSSERVHLHGLDRDSYQAEVTRRFETGELMIDYETYIDDRGAQRYAAIWERPPADLGYAVRTNLTGQEFANLWLTYRDQGLRLIDAETDVVSGVSRYGGVWLESDDRYRDPRRLALEALHDAQAPDTTDTAISITIIHKGEVIYRRGVDRASASTGQVAHSGTVYPAASISKVIGTTLAALLERRGSLRDGTPVTLDLSRPVRDYIAELPQHHAYTLEQLSAHFACIGHYTHYRMYRDQYPDLWTTQYYTALSAARDLWDIPLLPNCTIGDDWNYSTHAFTFLGAALESVTGHDMQTLLEREIFTPQELESTRVMYQAEELINDPHRADLVRDENNSWKILGGGVESTTNDLAHFGWRLMKGQIVDEETLWNRLWTPLRPNCDFGDRGVCITGLGWWLINDVRGRRVAYHNGGLDGPVAALWNYPDDELVIALLTNDNSWIDVTESLITAIADIALAE